ncbi:hypothetical protein A7982_13633 [Minicystis rosea]|nr:hypothetical protein A7982_13633 [Minicystis rosea]
MHADFIDQVSGVVGRNGHAIRFDEEAAVVRPRSERPIVFHKMPYSTFNIIERGDIEIDGRIIVLTLQ